MEIINDVGGQNTPNIMKFAMDADADANKGSFVTTSTSAVGGGVIPITAATPADIVGLITQLYDYSEEGTYSLSTATTAYPEVDVDVRPLAIYRGESTEVGSGQDTADSSAVGDTDITLTAITTNDDFNGCWFYDDGTEQIRFITDSAASGNTITISALTSVIGAAVLPRFALCRGGGLVSTYKQLKVSASYDYTTIFDALINNAPWSRVTDIRIQQSKGDPLDRLIPWKHDACVTNNAKLYHEFVVTDHIFKTIA